MAEKDDSPEDKKDDQSSDAANPGSDNPNMHGPGPVKPQVQRTSQAFREDPASQVIQPGYDAPDTCDNDRYAGHPTPAPVRRS